MLLFKKKITVSEMGTLLYHITVNTEYLNNTIDSLDNNKYLHRDNIRMELIILLIFIVDYLLRKPNTFSFISKVL